MHFLACKIMHPMHALSKREARQRKSRKTRGGEVIKNPRREGAGDEASMHVVVTSVAVQHSLLW